jgi:hypothetical protein
MFETSIDDLSRYFTSSFGSLEQEHKHNRVNKIVKKITFDFIEIS